MSRYAYAVAAITFGVIQIAWHDFATNWHPIPPEFPARQALVYISGTLLIAAGAALFVRRTARAGLAAIAAFFLFASLFWIRRIVHYPTIFGTWSGFAEQFGTAIGAMLCMAQLTPGSASLTRACAIGRMLLGLCIIAFGIIHLDALRPTAEMVPSWLPLGQTFWAIATGFVFIVSGLAVVVEIQARLAALLVTAMLCSFGLLVWIPRIVAHPERQGSWGGTAITLAVAAATWMVADTCRGFPRGSAPARPAAHSIYGATHLDDAGPPRA